MREDMKIIITFALNFRTIQMNIEQLYRIFRQHPVISTDSRTCPRGAIFFALKGDKFDGNDFVRKVLRAGAACAVADRIDEGAFCPPNIIKVDNALKTLQQLAGYHRKQMSATVIAITGTNGKTTTKELIAAALSTKYTTLYTKGNLNNHIGVPLTLLRLTPRDRFAVIEMGANHPGEIRDLCAIAAPDCGLITNVGKAHLEGFGSFEGVIRTKTELYSYLKSKKATVFANIDNHTLQGYHKNMSAIYYGTAPEAYIHGRVTDVNPTLQFEWQHGEVAHICQTQLAGAYNLENVLAAICVASRFDVPDDAINAAIAAYKPTNNRSQIVKTKTNTVIVDAYNANPSSMLAALENFKLAEGAKKVVILGEMKELGAYSHEEHQKIVDWLRDSGMAVLLVGKDFAECAALNPDWQVFDTTADLLSCVQQNPISDCAVLVKGSHANGLEAVVPCL
ncbi:UDP-N-acetylmuramoylalanyl-D-glutamyl-2,6-diaminopimelate--D-alanyl-D-alanine ligase [Candidatus Symbiothrix dinenymphae]|nr:UDP-N-acetylmuramoylalanyl-D-glutamyl-2,6-diaminopimelate--D-alanyl-D-alanine ligase [Candidatus Symbiothrix dinenymphae]